MGRYQLGLILVAALAASANAQAIWNGRIYSGRVCSSGNCAMCNSIQYQLSQARIIELTPPEPELANLSADQITDVLAMLRLTEDDVFADVGCGDGRLLIAAARRYGCRAVGIEIDETIAQQAYDAVKRLEREGILEPGQVQVFHGDAAKWDMPKDVSKGVAYLFPETLEHLSGLLGKIPHLVTPFHEIPGREAAAKVREYYVYVAPKIEIAALPPDPWSMLTYE